MSTTINLGQRLSFQLHVSEAELLALGLASPDVWEVDCFSLDNNRLILLDGVPCGALVTQADFTSLADDGVEEVVALEILPAFQRRGIARSTLCALAKDGRIRVNSPCESIARGMAALGAVREVDVSIVELTLPDRAR